MILKLSIFIIFFILTADQVACQNNAPYDSLKLAESLVEKNEIGKANELFKWYLLNRIRHKNFLTENEYAHSGIWLCLRFWHPVLEENPDHLSILTDVRDSLKSKLLNGPFNDYLSRDILYISQYLDDHYFVLDLYRDLEKKNIGYENLKLFVRSGNRSFVRINEINLLLKYFGDVEPLADYSQSELACFNQTIELLFIVQNKNWEQFSQYVEEEGLDSHWSMCYHEESSRIYSKDDIQQLSLDKTPENNLVKERYNRIIERSPWQQFYNFVNPGAALIFGKSISTDKKPRGYFKDCPSELYPKDDGYIHIEIYVEPEYLWSNSISWWSVRFIYQKENGEYKLRALMHNGPGV